MTSYVGARAETDDEITLMRTDEQWADMRLAIQPLETIYTARVNQVFTGWNSLTQVSYDGGSGTLANVLVGMTMWIGTAPGLYDHGIVRIRKTPTSNIFYFGEASDTKLGDNDYLTILNIFAPWAKPLRQTTTQTFMDYDIAFSAVAGFYGMPQALMGPVATVLKRTAGTIAFHPFGAGYSPISTISSYLNAAPGSSATSGLTTQSPTLTYTAAGCFRRSLRVTDANGQTGTGYRWVFIDPPSPEFELSNCIGDFDGGEWSFDVECSALDSALIYPQAMVVLWAESHYGPNEVLLGPITDHERVYAVGWIANKSIRYNARSGTVTFQVRGYSYFLNKEQSFPIGFQDKSSPTQWLHFPTLTVDKALYHLVVWRTTLSMITDVYFPGSTIRMRGLSLSPSSIWNQIIEAAQQTVFARPLVNHLGQIFIQPELSLLPTASRSAIPVVQSLSKEDWIGDILLDQNDTSEVGFVELSGVGAWDGSTSPTYFSRAPGDVPEQYGDREVPSNYLFSSQDDCNEKAGNTLALRENKAYKLELDTYNNPFVDITPYQYLEFTIEASDTPIGVSFTDKKFLPRRIELRHEAKTGFLTRSITCVEETTGTPGILYTPPVGTVATIPPIIMPPIPPIIPGGTDFPPLVGPPPGTTDDCGDTGAGENGPWPLAWDVGTLDAATGQVYAKAEFHATLRTGSYTNYGRVFINLTGTGDWASHIHLYGMNGDTIVATGSYVGTAGSQTQWDLYPAGAPEVITGLWLYLDQDADTDFSLTRGTAFTAVTDMDAGDGTDPIENIVPVANLVIGTTYILEISGGNLDYYNEANTGIHVFPYHQFTCTSGFDQVTVRRTDVMLSLTDLTTFLGDRHYSGHIGSRTEYYTFDHSCDNFVWYRGRPIGAIRYYLFNANGGIDLERDDTYLETLAPLDGGDLTNLGSMVFFTAVTPKIGIKVYPYYPGGHGTNWRYRIYNVVLVGERKVFIGDSFIKNICGT